MKKRILTTLLILTLAASSMTGCTQSSNDAAPSGADSPAVSQEPEDEPSSSNSEPGATSSFVDATGAIILDGYRLCWFE